MIHTRLLVGTSKGAFILDSDAQRRDWTVRGPLCEGWPIHDLIVEPSGGAILAAGGSPWYGPAVWRSEDGGDTWSHSSVGLTYGDGDSAEAIPTVWSLAVTPDGSLLEGGGAGRPVSERGRRRDVVTCRRPDQPPDPSDVGAGGRRPDPAHDPAPPD